MFYPNPKTIIKFLRYYVAENDYFGFREFYKAIGRNYFITKTDEFYEEAISFASKFKDNSTLVDIFLDIIDYEKTKLKSINEIVYANIHLLKDRDFVTCLENYVNMHKKDNKELESIGYKFALMLYKLHNKIDVKDVISDLNSQLSNEYSKSVKETSNKPSNSPKQILFNYNLKVFLRQNAGTEAFKELDKRILSYFDNEMLVNIFDEKEKEVKEPEPKEIVYEKKTISKEKTVEKKVDEKDKKKEEVISLQIFIPRKAQLKKQVVDEEDRKPAGGGKKK